MVNLRQTTRSEREPRRLFSNKCSCQIAQKCRCIFLHPKNKNFFAVFFNTKQTVAELSEVPQGYRDTITPIFCVILFDYELIYFRKSSASKRWRKRSGRRQRTAADGRRKEEALTRSGAPTRRSRDSKRATGGFLPQAGVRGKMSGGRQRRLLLTSTYWWVFGQDARRRVPAGAHTGSSTLAQDLPKRVFLK